MKFKISILFLLASTLLILSCTKQVINNEPTANTQTQGQLLAQVFEIDTSLVATKDTILKASFIYDQSERLIEKTILLRYENGNSSLIKTTFEYSNSDTTAYRAIKQNSISSFDTAYYSFLNGKYVSDSIHYSGSAFSANSFIFHPNIVERQSQGWAVLPFYYSWHEYQNIHQTKVNGNITYQIDTLIASSSNTAILTYQRFETTVTYLPNPNPYSKIADPIRKPYYNYYFANFSEDYAPKQLISKQVSNFDTWNSSQFPNNTHATNTLTYDYTFRTDGYPLEARVTYDVGPSVKKTKLVFIYKER